MHRSPTSPTESPAAPRPAIVCFSHLRWNLVFQRPQHILTRLQRDFAVLYWEEPLHDPACRSPRLERTMLACGVERAVPVLPEGLDADGVERALAGLLAEALAARSGPLVFWYYTPMMLAFGAAASPDLVVYDCMDELANFAFAPADIAARESELMARADLVLCGGRSLYEARAGRHRNIHCVPSGVDIAHFAGEDAPPPCDPDDQARLARPRLGFYGVIDERMDLALLAEAARMRPDWSFVMIGPVVKISPEDLPRAPNIHWLGRKEYAELPAYARHWDIALMPFARNEATRFISPTKTPEYMASGLPVISTPIADVIAGYGALAGIRIAGDAPGFVAAAEDLLAAGPETRTAWRKEAAACLADKDWNGIAAGIARRLRDTLVRRQVSALAAPGPQPERRHYDVLVVGAGFAGAVMAERLAAGSGRSVLVIDKRDHIAGNAYDHYDPAGIMVHRYGPHIFHTNSADIFAYLSRFTAWHPYEHRVLAAVDGQLLPMPINRTTLNRLYGLDLATDAEAADYLRSVAVDPGEIRNSRDRVISEVGEDLYARFFEGYTRKQWGVDPAALDKSVAARVPARTNTDDRYFTDRFQAMPAAGYTAMFQAMLDHPRITVATGRAFADLPAGITWDHLVWTGPVDEYFGHRLGRLPYRSLRFEHETLAVEQAQPVGVVNYPDEAVPHTRITEYKHLTGQRAPVTSLTREYPADSGDPYYPMPSPQAQALYRRYAALADDCAGVTFVGRLATYRYYNMDQVVGQALAAWRRLAAGWRGESDAPLAMAAAE